MPAKSEAQRRLAGIALAIKRGETTKSYSKEAAQMAKTMTVAELREFAQKPVHKGKKK